MTDKWENGHIENFSQKLRTYKQKPKIRKEVEVEKVINSNSQEVSVEELNQGLLKENSIINSQNWQHYLNYKKIVGSEGKVVNLNRSNSESLPIKLYNIKENQVEWTENNHSINNYAILSHRWGDLPNKGNLITTNEIISKQIGTNPEFNATGTTKLSIKYLKKEIEQLQT